jgi:hypothetical protein
MNRKYLKIFLTNACHNYYLTHSSRACMYAGVNISGTNAEVMPAQVVTSAQPD